MLSKALLYSAGPVGMAITGGVLATFWPPPAWLRSYIQHFAAGVVFSAVSVEILPDLMHRNKAVAAAVGFAMGAALMLAVRWISRQAGELKRERSGRRYRGWRRLPVELRFGDRGRRCD